MNSIGSALLPSIYVNASVLEVTNEYLFFSYVWWFSLYIPLSVSLIRSTCHSLYHPISCSFYTRNVATRANSPIGSTLFSYIEYRE